MPARQQPYRPPPSREQQSLDATVATLQVGLAANERLAEQTQARVDGVLDALGKVAVSIERLTQMAEATQKNLDKMADIQRALEIEKEKAHEHLQDELSKHDDIFAAHNERLAKLELKQGDEERRDATRDRQSFTTRNAAVGWALAIASMGLTVLVALLAIIAPHLAWK